MATVHKFASNPKLDVVGKKGALSPTCTVVVANRRGNVLIATLSPMFKSLNQWRREVQDPVMCTPEYNQPISTGTAVFSSGDLLVMHGRIGESIRLFLSCAITVGYNEITLRSLFRACSSLLFEASVPTKGGRSAGVAEVSEVSIVNHYASIQLKLAEFVGIGGSILGLVSDSGVGDKGRGKVAGKPSALVPSPRKRLEIPALARECWDAYTRGSLGSSDFVEDEDKTEEVDLATS